MNVPRFTRSFHRASVELPATTSSTSVVFVAYKNQQMLPTISDVVKESLNFLQIFYGILGPLDHLVRSNVEKNREKPEHRDPLVS